jgi:hypothetical protein
MIVHPSPSPDFLLKLVALANFMRLSLMKGARAALSGAAQQEIRFASPLSSGFLSKSLFSDANLPLLFFFAGYGWHHLGITLR